MAVWAAGCATRVLPIFEAERPGDERPAAALTIVRAWAAGECSVGQTRAAAVASHAAARDAGQTAALAARACGHAAATAHMADHALGAAFYALLAVAEAEPNDLNAERVWQLESLPKPVSDLVRSDMHLRAAKFAHIFDSPS